MSKSLLLIQYNVLSLSQTISFPIFSLQYRIPFSAHTISLVSKQATLYESFISDLDKIFPICIARSSHEGVVDSVWLDISLPTHPSMTPLPEFPFPRRCCQSPSHLDLIINQFYKPSVI